MKGIANSLVLTGGTSTSLNAEDAMLKTVRDVTMMVDAPSVSKIRFAS